MANPFLGESNFSTPSAVNDHRGDEMFFPTTAFHVAGLLLIALLIVTVMKVSGFRAMVGLGRG